MMGANDYIEARAEFVRTAKEEAARISGEPLPAEKKPAGVPALPRPSSQLIVAGRTSKRPFAEPLRCASYSVVLNSGIHQAPIFARPPGTISGAALGFDKLGGGCGRAVGRVFGEGD